MSKFHVVINFNDGEVVQVIWVEVWATSQEAAIAFANEVYGEYANLTVVGAFEP